MKRRSVGRLLQREPVRFCGYCENEGMVSDLGCTLNMVRVRCLRPCPECSGGGEWAPCGHQRAGGGQ